MGEEERVRGRDKKAGDVINYLPPLLGFVSVLNKVSSDIIVVLDKRLT